MMSTPIHQVERLVHEGRFLEARSRTEALLKETNDVRLKQLLALSMAKSGAPKAAMALLEPLYQQHPGDPETSGILGSIYKALFKETQNSKYAVLSRDTYLRNYTLTGNHYTGINAASMYAISGSMSKAKEIAKEIIARLDPASTDIWELASLAEANLLLREKESAIDLYLRCRQLIGPDWGTVSSIYHQLWLLNHYIPVSSQVMNTFSPPAVAAFVGHMIDQPGRALGRFPEAIEQDVKQAIAGSIRSINAKIGFCSLACGSDILFAEAMAECGGEVNLFLPFDEDDFIKTSVAYAGDVWVKRFEALKEKFPVNDVTAERYKGNDDLFSFQSQVIFGAAVQRAALLHASPHLITVYADADVVKKRGGTYDTLKMWPHEQKRININPQNYMHGPLAENAEADISSPALVQESKHRHVRYLVRVDFENANVEDGNRFAYQVNKKIGDMHIDEVGREGNALLFALKTVEEAIVVAWAILKMPGFSPMTSISLHAGPVYSESRVAGISGPATDILRAIGEFSVPGKVYASFQFASVLSLHARGYALEYAGIIASSPRPTGIFQVNRHADAFDL